ncbi:hypothetical protein KIW84_065126 [Lathyrus oleraceus]|uniref:Gag-pol polyprotein n=1 Tax=Pisum sativum TaxID=3888 RepID=A0A9D4WG54_PEA|nr:hypothetical protein KIW84_065126 [Pisum sativum]
MRNQASTSNERKKITFDPIPMSYAELYPSLIERNLITPRDPPAIPDNPRWWYKPDQHCVYHSGALGHDVESCFQLKNKLLYSKSLCKLIPKPIEHNDPTPSPNFEFPVFEAEEDDVEGIPDEISRLLGQEKKITQLYLENQQNNPTGALQM